jgi:hypothetical protein
MKCDYNENWGRAMRERRRKKIHIEHLLNARSSLLKGEREKEGG